MTINRTSTPTEAQVEAAAKALFDEMQDLDQDNDWGDPLPDEWRESWLSMARAALEAAAGVAPQAPNADCEECGRWVGGHDLEGCRTLNCRCKPVPVQLSSTVDECDTWKACE